MAPFVFNVDMEEGALEAGLQRIRHGTPEEALKAAKSLGFTAYMSMPSDSKCLEQDVTIHAMLKVFDIPRLSVEDRRVLHESMTRLVMERPCLAAQVVNACANPDPRIAFAALVCTKLLLGDREDKVSPAMLKAGAIPAIISALKHSSAYCRAAAASVAAGGIFDDDVPGILRTVMFGSPESLEALLEAGLVHALVDVIRAGASDNAPPASPGVFSNINVQMMSALQLVTLPNSEPALHACHALGLLTRTDQAVRVPEGGWGFSKAKAAAEVAKTAGAASALVRCLRQYAGELQDAPAQLILAVLRTLSGPGDTSRDACKRTFCRELQEAGLPDLLPSLIRPEQPGVTLSMLGTLSAIIDALGGDCLPRGTVPALAGACATYIGEGRDGKFEVVREDATYCLGRLVMPLPMDERFCVPLSQPCITKLAGVMVSGPFHAAWRAGFFVVERIDRPDRIHKADRIEKAGKMAKAAMAGGFVPGILRLARERHLAPNPERLDSMVVCAIQYIAAFGGERYLMQAIDSGLIPFLESYLGRPEFHKVLLMTCTSILKVKPALAELRKGGFASSVVRAAHSVVDLGWWVSKHCRASGLVAEFVDAGLLEKLETVRTQMARQPAKQREVAALIDELARIGGSGSPGAASRGHPGELELRDAEVQERVLAMASAVVVGGGGPVPKKDLLAPGLCGKQQAACAQCGESGEEGARLLKCSGCRSVVYCGRECQRNHWRRHKPACRG